MSENELGEFLRSRRAKANAELLGTPSLTRRRVSGLRREELASLAGLSASYYARLEQGKDRNPSPEVLTALARALRLDDAERRYLHALGVAGPSAPRSGNSGSPDQNDERGRERRAGTATDGVSPGLQHLLKRWADLPAFVVSTRRDVLAATELAALVNPAWTPGANLLEFTFTNARARDVYVDWEQIAAQAVTGLRASAVDRPAEVADLVADLRQRSAQFRDLWDGHDVADRTEGWKRLNVPELGVVRLQYETFAVTAHPGSTLFVYFPAQGSEDEAGLRGLSGRLRA